jgi:hypothetical protein
MPIYTDNTDNIIILFIQIEIAVIAVIISAG